MYSRSLETVLPLTARYWLSKYTEKNLDMDKINEFAMAISKGNWEPNLHEAAPIMIRGGVLLNGHHRLFAVLLVGYGVPMYVEIS